MLSSFVFAFFFVFVAVDKCSSQVANSNSTFTTNIEVTSVVENSTTNDDTTQETTDDSTQSTLTSTTSTPDTTFIISTVTTQISTESIAIQPIVNLTSIVTSTSSTSSATTVSVTVTTQISTESIAIQPTITSTNIVTSTSSTSSETTVPVNVCTYGYYYNGSSCEECGLTSVAPNVRIIGGVQAAKGSWPSNVLIASYKIVNGETKFNSFCGGTLISRQTVVTSAQCVSENVDFYVAFLGVYNITGFITLISSYIDQSVIIVGVSNIIVHPSFDLISLQNDIALFVLDTPITPSANVSVACLPQTKTNSYPSFNRNAWVAGWGSTSESGPSSTILNNVMLTIYDPTNCQQVSSTTSKNWNSQICAGDISGGKDTCQRDLGSGLYVSEFLFGKFKYFAAGITSYGDGCGRPNLPKIYTRVGYYVDWIRANLDVTKTNFATTTKITFPPIDVTQKSISSKILPSYASIVIILNNFLLFKYLN